MVSGGDVYVAGGFAATIDPGGGSLTSAGDSDIYLARFDSSGAALGATRFGSDGYDGPAHLASHGSALHLIGRFTGSVSFGGDPLTSAPGVPQMFLATLSAPNSIAP